MHVRLRTAEKSTQISGEFNSIQCIFIKTEGTKQVTKPVGAEETEKEDLLSAQEIDIAEGRQKQIKKTGDLNTIQSMIKICRRI